METGGGGVRGIALLVWFGDLGDISPRLAKNDPPKTGCAPSDAHSELTHRAQSAGTRFASGGTSLSERSEYFASLGAGEWRVQVELPLLSCTRPIGKGGVLELDFIAQALRVYRVI